MRMFDTGCSSPWFGLPETFILFKSNVAKGKQEDRRSLERTKLEDGTDQCFSGQL
jgi:hypothetical protein